MFFHIIRLTMLASDAIWRCIPRYSLFHVKACCLVAPSYYLNHCWPMVEEAHVNAWVWNYNEYLNIFYGKHAGRFVSEIAVQNPVSCCRCFKALVVPLPYIHTVVNLVYDWYCGVHWTIRKHKVDYAINLLCFGTSLKMTALWWSCVIV